MDTYVVLWLSWVKLLWTWGCRSLSYTPHPIHFSLSPLLLSWSKFPFLASFYISLPPVLSLAINFLTQFQFCFIPEEYMYIVLRFGIKNWRLPLDSLLQVSHSQFIFMIGAPENLDYRGKLVDCGVITLQCLYCIVVVGTSLVDYGLESTRAQQLWCADLFVLWCVGS